MCPCRCGAHAQETLIYNDPCSPPCYSAKTTLVGKAKPPASWRPRPSRLRLSEVVQPRLQVLIDAIARGRHGSGRRRRAAMVVVLGAPRPRAGAHRLGLELRCRRRVGHLGQTMAVTSLASLTR